ncbi:hypothetical protein AOLI_G00027170 [Acnodon oligacanthus]
MFGTFEGYFKAATQPPNPAWSQARRLKWGQNVYHAGEWKWIVFSECRHGNTPNQIIVVSTELRLYAPMKTMSLHQHPALAGVFTRLMMEARETLCSRVFRGNRAETGETSSCGEPGKMGST